MLDKIIGIVMFAIFGVFTLFVFDFIRIAFGDNVYSNTLLLVLGALVIVMNLLIAVLVKSLK